MKKNLFLSTASICLLLASCTKDKTQGISQGGGDNSASRVKTASTSSGLETDTYDASGRHTQTDFTTGMKKTYEYTKTNVTESVYVNSTLDKSYYYELNPDGTVGQETRSAQPGFNATRIYNADKQLVRLVSYYSQNNIQTLDYFISNGNCDSVRSSVNGAWTNTTKNTYYTDKPNGLGNDVYGETYYGKSDKNLLKSTQYFYNDGSTGTLSSYTYEFDANGRVVKATATGNNIDIVYYTY